MVIFIHPIIVLVYFIQQKKNHVFLTVTKMATTSFTAMILENVKIHVHQGWKLILHQEFAFNSANNAPWGILKIKKLTNALYIVIKLAILRLIIYFETLFQVNVSELVDVLMILLIKFKLMVPLQINISVLVQNNAHKDNMVILNSKYAHVFVKAIIHIRISSEGYAVLRL